MLGVQGWRLHSTESRRVEPVWTCAEAAVTHAGNHKEPCEFLRFLFAAKLSQKTFIEVDGLPYRHDRIRPTLEEDQLPAAIAELADVACHCSVQRRPKCSVDLDHVPVHVESAPIPVGAKHPLEEAVKSRLARGVAGRLEESPIEDARLASRQLAIEERLAVLVGGSKINRFCGLDLLGGQAIVGRAAFAG